MVLAVSALLAGCSDEMGNFGRGSGHISPTVGLDNEVEGLAKAPASRADGDITVSDLSLTLTKDDGSYVHTWDSVDDFPVDQSFTVGTYTMEAFYGDDDAEGFDVPAYRGSQSLRVADGQTTSLALTASMTKSMFTIVYTDAFKSYMQAWSAQLVTASATHAYAGDETRPLYVKPGEVSLRVSVTKPSGLEATFEVAKLNAEARHHYTITVNVNDGNVGDATLSVSFDESLQQETIDIDLSDKLLSAPVPELEAVGFTAGTPVEVVSGLSAPGEVKMNIVALAGLESVMLATSSESLLSQGWPAEVELLGADAATQSALTALGLKVLGLWKQPDKMAVVDFTDVFSNIRVVEGNNHSTFTVTVKDSFKRVGEPLQLDVDVEEIQLELASAVQFYTPGENLNVSLGFNGTDVEHNAAFEYYNPTSGTYRPLDIVSVSAPVSRSMSDYVVTLATPELDDAITLRAKCGDKVSGNLVVTNAPFMVAAAANDIYARSAYVSVVPTDDNPAPNLSAPVFSVKAEGQSEWKTVNSTRTGDYFFIDGLTPASTNYVRVTIDGMSSRATAVVTEAINQIENSNLDAWSRVDGKSSYWWIDYPAADRNNSVWATLNELTTSAGTAAGATSCGYSAKSGTTPATGDDAHAGKAALIQTVGWGKNTVADAAGWIAKFKSENFTPGELYLGTYNASTKSAEYSGCEFASRPAALTFYAKYLPKNSADWASAEISVLDAAGAVIASNTLRINATADYTKMSVPLTFAPGKNKAARLVVKFKSTCNNDVLTLSESNFDYPPRMSVTTSQGYIGSKLYIDDIELTY